MSIYLSRSFPRSNSSFFLCSGNALQSEVLRLREEMFLVYTGLGTPRICMQDELTGVPINRATRFENKGGSLDLVAGEPLLLLPRRFRQNRAWMELNKIWRTNTKVKGFIIKKIKGGYSVAIAGFFAFLPFRRRRKKGISNYRFTIESINPKKMNIVVFCSNSGRSNKNLMSEIR
uniref:Ribosomal protein S1 n=2 Tax=Damnacanthus indicus TaxID=58425 RepID=A0A8F8X781_9GENT|nr:ribosomal protein S1 [Damnacanthus indicus var. indicus]QYB18160.1 ribosomal protein S1 [Damnacanthus indicus var. microphyllus]QYB18064.1 ribosomal protein S1 [Damnacanthus indicus var. indicus]QYB18096.1 ribosomal protein S1 [Damnacanthus indicus var. indicus]QYB18128.1 ribosomal protein S1 [Damnacanthus indicus var. indicus]